jgi:hypothetical protein
MGDPALDLVAGEEAADQTVQLTLIQGGLSETEAAAAAAAAAAEEAAAEAAALAAEEAAAAAVAEGAAAAAAAGIGGTVLAATGVGLLVLGVVALGYYLYTESAELEETDQPTTVESCPLAAAAAAASGSATYKPVIPNQQYSDQTCTDQELEGYQKVKDQIEDDIDDAPGYQLPKKPYQDPIKQTKLCDKLRNKKDLLQKLLDIRRIIDKQCFNSPKSTDDEKVRDDGHKKQIDNLKDALKNIDADIEKYCTQPGQPPEKPDGD